MKTRFISTVFFFSLGAVLWMGNSLGRAAGGNGNSTVNGCGNNGSCHAGGTFQGVTKLSVTKNGNIVTKYIPGTIYQVELSVEKTGGTGSPAGFGFQLTASKGNRDAGVFSNASPKGNTQITPLNGRTFVEHNLLISSGKVTVNWTAPPVGTGNVTFFAASTLVNGANGNKGDTPTPAITLSLSEGTGVSSNDFADNLSRIEVINNPWGNQHFVSFFAEGSSLAEIGIFRTDGQPVYYSEVQITEGENTLPIQLATWESGMYILWLKVNGKLMTTRLMKM